MCTNLIGTVLQPGAANAVTCNFTVLGYAPAAGTSLVDTVTVVGHRRWTTRTTRPPIRTRPRCRTPGSHQRLDRQGQRRRRRRHVQRRRDGARRRAAVPFRAVITNTVDVQVRITSLTDVLAGGSVPGICANLIGTILDPGQSVPCTFSVAGYSPPFGQQRCNTAAVTVVDVQQPERHGAGRGHLDRPHPAEPDHGLRGEGQRRRRRRGLQRRRGGRCGRCRRCPSRRSSPTPRTVAVTITSLTDVYSGVNAVRRLRQPHRHGARSRASR